MRSRRPLTIDQPPPCLAPRVRKLRPTPPTRQHRESQSVATRRGIGAFWSTGQTWDLPVPAQGASTHARFFDPAGSPSLAISCLTMLPSAFETASAPGTVDFVAQWLAYALPYRRFVDVLANGNARLGADVVRYTFIVSDFHRLLLAGLPAHFECDHPSHAVGLTDVQMR